MARKNSTKQGNQYSLIIFDMDGTLVQSEDCASQALKDVMPGLLDTRDEVTERYRGMRLAHIFEDIESRYPGAVPDDCLDKYRLQEERLSSDYITACDGAAELLSTLLTPVCIASNAPVEKTRRSLSITNLAKHFSSPVYSAYEVMAWKPDPALFLHAAYEHKTDVESCLVIEDSDVGIQAGLAAGMDVIHYDPHEQGSNHSVPSIGSLLELLEIAST